MEVGGGSRHFEDFDDEGGVAVGVEVDFLVGGDLAEVSGGDEWLVGVVLDCLGGLKSEKGWNRLGGGARGTRRTPRLESRPCVYPWTTLD